MGTVSWHIVWKNDVNVIVAHPADLQKTWARQLPVHRAFTIGGWSMQSSLEAKSAPQIKALFSTRKAGHLGQAF